MRLATPLLAAASVLVTTVGLVLSGTAAASAAPAWQQSAPLPDHVFAPYFESFNGDSPAALAQASGAKYLTMAFLQTATAGSCTVDWNGSTDTPVAASTYGADIASIKAHGGDVIPSFGGYAADDTGTEIADSCTDVGKIAAAYENVITTYHVTRLDLDTEDKSLTNPAGIDRRNKAIALVEKWAARTHHQVQFSYTLPTFPTGLSATGLSVLQNAAANGARIDVVNIMTFDYYDGVQHEMATDTESAAAGTVAQMAGIWPHRSTRSLWAGIGVTEMVGIDDYGPSETFSLADATAIEKWAVAKNINTVSFWALQRDNGSCVGTKGAGVCSGVAQSTWQFSHILEPFTSKRSSPWW